jgi:hypothetical protein
MLRMLTPSCMLLAHHECCLPIDARHRSEHHRCDRLRVRIRSDDHAKQHGNITDARCSRAVAEWSRAGIIIIEHDDAAAQ